MRLIRRFLNRDIAPTGGRRRRIREKNTGELNISFASRFISLYRIIARPVLTYGHFIYRISIFERERARES